MVDAEMEIFEVARRGAEDKDNEAPCLFRSQLPDMHAKASSLSACKQL